MSGSLSPGGISLSLSGGTSGAGWSMVIDPPIGSRFKEGYYSRAQRAEFRTAGHPGLDITGDGRGCNTVSGSFEVRKLVVSNSTITQLDLLYEQHCEGGPAALFGEIQIGQPRPAGLIMSSMRLPGRPPRTVPGSPQFPCTSGTRARSPCMLAPFR
jgi:hypothetical protein